VFVCVLYIDINEVDIKGFLVSCQHRDEEKKKEICLTRAVN